MSLTTQSFLKPLGITTNGCLISVPPFVTTVKVSYSQTRPSICIKPIKFQLSCSYASSVPSLFTLKKKDSVLRVSIAAAQGEESPALLEEEQGIPGNFNWGGSDNDVEGGDSEGYAEPLEEAKVYVGNLPYDVDSEKLAELFQEAGVVEISEVIYDRETDRSRGFGFVTMSTVEEAEKAVGMFSRYDLNGRQLTVNKAAPRGSRAERPPRVVETNPKIYVGNLAWSMDDSALERVFSEYGKVLSARVVSDRESGRSRGFGFVVMSNVSEMNDAIANLDGQSFDGRQIKVNVAEEKPRRPRF